jgi:hypothetical protein
LTGLLHRAGVPANGLDASIYLRTQQPVEVDDRRQYQPDFSVARGPLDRYAEHLPRAADTLLVVEVADTTLGRDLGDKLAAYQHAGFPLIVVVNVPDRSVHRFERRATGYDHAILVGEAEWYSGIRVQDVFPD